MSEAETTRRSIKILIGLAIVGGLFWYGQDLLAVLRDTNERVRLAEKKSQLAACKAGMNRAALPPQMDPRLFCDCSTETLYHHRSLVLSVAKADKAHAGELNESDDMRFVDFVTEACTGRAIELKKVPIIFQSEESVARAKKEYAHLMPQYNHLSAQREMMGEEQSSVETIPIEGATP